MHMTDTHQVPSRQWLIYCKAGNGSQPETHDQTRTNRIIPSHFTLVNLVRAVTLLEALKLAAREIWIVISEAVSRPSYPSLSETIGKTIDSIGYRARSLQPH